MSLLISIAQSYAVAAITFAGALSAFFNRLSFSILHCFLLQATTTTTVQEVNDQTDDQPYNKANEGDPGQAHNQHQRTNYGEDGNQWNQGHPKSSPEIGLHTA